MELLLGLGLLIVLVRGLLHLAVPTAWAWGLALVLAPVLTSTLTWLVASAIVPLLTSPVCIPLLQPLLLLLTGAIGYLWGRRSASRLF